MPQTFLNNRKTTRLTNWNYSWKSLYFVTINTRFGENYFGDIINGVLYLNEIGKETEKQWLLTPAIRPDMNLHLDDFIIMPNHFHAIIGIGYNNYNRDIRSLSEFLLPDSNSINKSKFLNGIKIKEAQSCFGPQRKNLGSIIRGFKSSVTQWCRIHNKEFNWHSRYHDIIIRDEKMLNNIRNYIKNNPLKWKSDKFNKK